VQPTNLSDEFRSWLQGPAFSCLGGRAAANRHMLTCSTYYAMSAIGALPGLHDDLLSFIDGSLKVGEGGRDRVTFASFVALFPAYDRSSEGRFERDLWHLLAALRGLDERRGFATPEGYSSETSSPHFAISVGGEAFFVVGVHPGASRISRRFGHRAAVFNSHSQFKNLKATGVYGKLQRRVRERELRIQGSTNPYLGEHGNRSEARQYASVAVEDWSCPVESLSRGGTSKGARP
jgi:FPC/CPF motif-containing protein YcgG